MKTFGISSRDPEIRIINNCYERYVIHYILCGKGWCNGIPFQEGDVIFCTKFRPYSISSNKSDPCIFAWVTFQGGKCDDYIQRMGLNQSFLSYKMQDMTRICEIFYDMMEIDHSNIETALYLESSFLKLLSYSMPPAGNKCTEAKNSNKRIDNAVLYISKHFNEPNIMISDIAHAVNTNEKYLQRLFKEEMGMSIYKYISKLRFDAALSLLTNSNYSISMISEYVGFNDVRTFSEAFKKRFGKSPVNYRQ